MALSLRIENASSLPDGGPLGIEVAGKRGVDIGRDQHLDWTLPDPTRFISGKHCEIRYKDGDYWLHDVSTNGTFLNGSEERMRSPHRLQTGDRLEIGDYLVAVRVELEDAAVARTPARPAPRDDLWSVAENVAPPLAIDPRRSGPDPPPPPLDFLDHLVESSGRANDALWNDGAQAAARGRPRRSDRDDDLDWAVETPARPLAVPPPPHSPISPERSPEPAVAEAPMQPLHRVVADRSPTPPADFVRLLAKGAGVPESVFARLPPAELAEEMGVLLRVMADNLKQLLTARSELKDIVHATTHTMVMAADNNPLKFAPTVDEALALMFAPASGSYLDARRTIEQSFKDLKHHQIQTYSAMQVAIGMLVQDLDPKTIEQETEPDRGLSAMVGSRKAKFWDAYVARWRIKVSRHEDGLLGVFLNHFAECYDRASGRRR